MTDEQRIEDLVDKFFNYVDHKIHFDGEITTTTVDLQIPIEDIATYRATTKAITKPHGHTPHNPPTRI
jgi:hypothetical protein